MPEYRGKILLVDSHLAERSILGTELRAKGYTVFEVEEGREALKIYASPETTPDLTISEIKLPGMDGFELLSEVKKSYPKSRFIVLTSYADLRNAIESKKRGTDDFMSQPYDLVDMLTTIEHILSQSPATLQDGAAAK